MSAGEKKTTVASTFRPNKKVRARMDKLCSPHRKVRVPICSRFCQKFPICSRFCQKTPICSRSSPDMFPITNSREHIGNSAQYVPDQVPICARSSPDMFPIFHKPRPQNQHDSSPKTVLHKCAYGLVVSDMGNGVRELRGSIPLRDGLLR